MTGTLTDRTQHLVLPVATLGRGDLALAGGKGANLGELVRAGFPVPDAVVISTAAYTAVVESGGLAGTITAGLRDGDGGAGIRAAFAAVTIPDGLRAEITAAYAGLGGGPVAVRSSATAEDLPGAAFAGQQDTYLNVHGEAALLDAVRRCWGSLWTERAIAYRDRRGVDQVTVRIAVVVQRMVPAEHAGVLFTANPVTGRRDEVVIDASSGLGEAVVSGLVTPDHYVLDAGGAVRARTPGRREVVIRGVAGGGLTESTDERPDPLPEPALVELATLGRAVAAHFGRPQDIEWARADGRLWLLQARPMTALPPAPLHLGRARRRQAQQLLDYFTERPYPMDVSAWIRPGIGHMVERALLEITGLRVNTAEMLPEIDGVVDQFVPPRPRPTPAMLSAPARLARRIRRFTPSAWEQDQRFGRFRQEIRELGSIDPAALDWPELTATARRALATAALITDLRVDFLPRSAYDLLRLHAMAAVLRVHGLTVGTRTRTEDANRALAELAAQVRDDPALHEAFARLDGPALLERITSETRFGAFHTALRAFLTEYGHRETISPLLMSAPTWGDAPTTVLALISVLAAGPARPPAAEPAAATAANRLTQHPLIRRTGTAAAALRVAAAARAGIAFREDTHFHLTALLPILRRLVLEAGRRLAAADVLPDVEDVFHLRLEELERCPDPARLTPGDSSALREVALQRSARRAELAGAPMISRATLYPDAADPGADSDATVRGVPASGGRVTAPVRVVRGPEGFGTLRDGEVLVCPYTNPAWTPLFQRAAAVVVDAGGSGSHAAIVAREYAIPAVMGTGNGTTTLTDGQLVTVDGDAGRVTAADPARG